MSADVRLVRAETADHWRAARRLLREYEASLDVGLEFQNFEAELQHLEQEYGPPGGCFLLAVDAAGSAAACGALRRFSDSACEMKRLFVQPDSQRLGLGRRLVLALLDEARRLGYRTILLDTLPSMHRAQDLYRALGFTPVEPYRYNPVPGASFWSLDLSSVVG